MNIHLQVTTENTGTWSVTDLKDEMTTGNSSSEISNGVITTSTSTTVDDDDVNLPIEDILHEKAGESSQPSVIERSNTSLKDETTSVLTCALEAEIQELKDQIDKEKLKVKAQKQSTQKLSKEKDEQLQKTEKLLKNLQQELLNKQSHEQQFKNLQKQIKAVDYTNIQSIIVNVFLFGKQKQIVQHLKTKHKVNDYFLGIPNITILEENNLYSISVIGLQEHHNEFKFILKRIQTLSNVTQSAKGYYQRQLNAILRSINYIMIKHIRSSQEWKYYVKNFQQLIKNKIEEFIKFYDEYIIQKAKGMIEECIIDSNFQSWIQIRKLTTTYMKMKQFEPELEILKYEALDIYIKQHVLSERSKFEMKPSFKSLQTMNEFIDKVRNEFKTNPIYVGCKLEQLKEIPKLLQRIVLYYRCFLLQLPLYESSKDLLDKIENNTVITIATSTGSGKLYLLLRSH